MSAKINKKNNKMKKNYMQQQQTMLRVSPKAASVQNKLEGDSSARR